MTCKYNCKFRQGEYVVSLVAHPPEIKSGTTATIATPLFGTLLAVKMPDGELHRWFASFELEPINCESHCLKEGDFALVSTNIGHPPIITIGMRVQIVRAIQTDFYAVYIEGMKYHRWLAGFELAHETS